MIIGKQQWPALGLAAVSTLALGGCLASFDQEGWSAAQEEGDDDRAAVNHTKIVDDIKLNSAVQGHFNPRVRKYGYIIDAQFGSTLTLTLEKALAGSDVVCNGQDAEDGVCAPAGTPLDTRMGVYGPFPAEGELDLSGYLPPIAETEDVVDGSGSITSMAAPPLSVAVPESARYLVMFESHQDTGSGEYRLALGCQGTEYQCQQPNWDRPCTKERRYVQGSVLEGVVDTCETIVLESVTVPEGKTLSIKPGVEMQMNYLGTGAFGTVTLNVAGTLQAVGTAEHPIRFTPHTQQLPNDSPNDVQHLTRGWAGIVLMGPDEHTVEHVFIEGANNALTVSSGASAQISDVVLDGAPVSGTMPATGVLTSTDVEAAFVRALVKGYQIGLHLQNSRRLTVEDSVVRNNAVGVRITGATPSTSCPSAQPPAPHYWRDPIFRHTDFIDNTTVGLQVYGSDILLQVEYCNIRRNRLGIQIQGTQLAEGSYVRNNNILENAPVANAQPGQTPYGVQFQSYHRFGVLQLQNNYWMYHSDPELSQMRQLPCNANGVNFSGFAFEPIAEAGPRPTDLSDAVQQETWNAQAN